MAGWSFYRSKGFWLTSTILGGPIAYWLYDRYETRQIIKKYITVARPYGLEGLAKVSMASISSPTSISSAAPSPVNPGANGLIGNNLSAHGLQTEGIPSTFQSSSSLTGLLQHRRFTLFVQGENALLLKEIYDDVWLKYIEPIWSAAGVDYVWLEASLKKHLNEYDKLLKQVEFNRDHSSDESFAEAGTKKGVEVFEHVSGWRVRHWLVESYQSVRWKEAMHEFVERQQRLAESSFWNRWFSSEAWMQPPSEELIRRKCLEESPLFRDQYRMLQETLNNVNISNSSDMNVSEKSLVNRVLLSLLPPVERLPIDIDDMFHEGIIGVSLPILQQLVHVLQELSQDYPKEFACIFKDWLPGHTLRLGYLPLPSELRAATEGNEKMETLVEKLMVTNGKKFESQVPAEFCLDDKWYYRFFRFFHQRHLAAFYGDWAITFIHEKAIPSPTTQFSHTFYLNSS